MKRTPDTIVPSQRPNPLHDQVAADVEAFLARGGRITEVPPGVSGVDNEMLKRVHVARAQKAAHARRSKRK